MKVYILTTFNPDAHNYILSASTNLEFINRQIPDGYEKNQWCSNDENHTSFVKNSDYLSIITIEVEIKDNTFTLFYDIEEYEADYNISTWGKGSQKQILELDKVYEKMLYQIS
jgi:hypothetical protein